MPLILKYLFLGLVLMVPQELVVHIFREFVLIHFLMAMTYWAMLLTLMYGISRITKRFIKREGLELALSMILYALLAIGFEWGIIGNSPQANPSANQIGMLAAWVSVFTLPRLFLETGYEKIKKWVKWWYFPFVILMFLPIIFIPEKGTAIGVILYGYLVIPFLFFSVWYLIEKMRN